MSTELNPYQVSTPQSSERSQLPENLLQFRYARSIVTWSLICALSAAPSFLFALSVIAPGTWVDMVLVIVFAIGFYVVLDKITFYSASRSRPSIVIAMRIAYGMRVAASILFPVGSFIDVICGIFTGQIMAYFNELGPIRSRSFPSWREVPMSEHVYAIIWTVLQAIAMHGVLMCVFLPCFGLLVAVDADKRWPLRARRRWKSSEDSNEEAKAPPNDPSDSSFIR